MPPKVKITKEDIINAAVDIVRKEGAQAINARTLASYLNCSTQPVFSNFAVMSELRLAVVQKADELYNQYIKREIESEKFPPYKASGMAYIRFASEEKELFKLLFMRDRTDESYIKQIQFTDGMDTLLQKNTGLDSDTAKLFHFEMWAYVHGIATMLATNFLTLDFELVSRMLSDAYLGMRKQYELE
ncbi:MAG: WHG domain-containing protein [Ruminococcaceae bacterium]|nr:WHG domain-containing protein [Oscillospiraceae bacterium]